jgi:CRP-like cAMP-binding protein
LPAREGAFFLREIQPTVSSTSKKRPKIPVLSSTGKEAIIRFVVAGDFFGEKAMAFDPGLRVTTATALTDCTAIRTTRAKFLRLIRE